MLYKQNYFGEDDYWGMLADAGFQIPIHMNDPAREGEHTGRSGLKPTPVGMSLAYVPAGSFLMGSDAKGMPEWPVHRVEVSGFWIGQYEVTYGQFDHFEIRHSGSSVEDYPVQGISYADAVSTPEEKYTKSRGKSAQFTLVLFVSVGSLDH